MEHRRFDALTRALGAAGSRRAALTAVLGGAVGLLAADSGSINAASDKKKDNNGKHRHGREVKAEGPCGNGSAKKNRCKRDRQCCTDYCRKGRCRCRKAGQSCTADQNCCPERTGRTCLDGTCQAAPACLGQGEACPGDQPCCEGLSCQDGFCQPCDVCARGCDFVAIQDAIGAASEGDTIHICAGTYKEALTIGKGLTLIGAGDGADGAVVDGQKDGTTVSIVNGAVVGLEGLRITGGSSHGIDIPGGNVTLTNCTVTGNTTGAIGGGGIYSPNTFNVLTLTNCIVSDNTADIVGGGIYNPSGSLILNDCTVTDNVAGNFGGGLYNGLGGTIVLNGASRVTLNSVTGSDGAGGGIYNDRGAVTLNDSSSVTDNTPDDCAGNPAPVC